MIRIVLLQSALIAACNPCGSRDALACESGGKCQKVLSSTRVESAWDEFATGEGCDPSCTPRDIPVRDGTILCRWNADRTRCEGTAGAACKVFPARTVKNDYGLPQKLAETCGHRCGGCVLAFDRCVRKNTCGGIICL